MRTRIVCISIVGGVAMWWLLFAHIQGGAKVTIDKDGTVHLPLVSRHISVGREDPRSWYVEENQLVVGTGRFAASFSGGDVLWINRIPSGTPDTYNCDTVALPLANGHVCVIQWVLGTNVSRRIERGITFAAYSLQTGKLGDSRIETIPDGITPQLLTAIPYRDGCLALLGDPGKGLAKVEMVLEVRWVSGNLEVKENDPMELRGWTYLDHRRDGTCYSVILGKGSAYVPETTFRVIRSQGDFDRSLIVPVAICWGAMDLPTENLLLTCERDAGGKEWMLAFDLATGLLRWKTEIPEIIVEFRSANRTGGTVFYASEDGAVVIDVNKGKVFRLTNAAGERIVDAGAFAEANGRTLIAQLTHAINGYEYSFVVSYRDMSDGKIRPSFNLVVRADEDEPLLSGGVTFLEVGTEGWWLGTGCGTITYRTFSPDDIGANLGTP